jgi:hypothetical protein
MKGRTIAEWDSRRDTEFDVTFWVCCAELVNSTGKVSVKFVRARFVRETGMFTVCDEPWGRL